VGGELGEDCSTAANGLYTRWTSAGTSAYDVVPLLIPPAESRVTQEAGSPPPVWGPRLVSGDRASGEAENGPKTYSPSSSVMCG
jgi:hypothetical protein